MILQDNTSNKSHFSIIIYCYPRLTAMIFLEFQKHDSITTYNRLNFDGTIKEKNGQFCNNVEFNRNMTHN